MKIVVGMKVTLLLFIFIPITHGNVLAENSVIPSLEGYNNLLSIELKSGDMSIYETLRGSNLAVSIDMKNSPLCKTEVVADPARVLIDCPGRILQGTKPIKLTNSKMAKQIRFGYSGNNSKIVIDLNADVLAVQAPEAEGDKSIFVFGGLGQSLIAKEPDVQRNAKLVAEMEKQTGGPVTVFTPVPLPEILHGETNLTALVFTKSAELNGPIVKMSLGAGRKTELKRKSATQYILKIDAARVISPIFTSPQNAPDGFNPFLRVQISEVVSVAGPVNLSVQIELSSPAELQVKQSAGDIEVYTGAEVEAEPKPKE